MIKSLVSVLKEGVSKVACGENHSALLLKTGSVLTAGSNEYMQLGRTLEEDRTTCWKFEAVPGLKPMKDVSCWNMTGCIDLDKNLYLWGSIFSLKESHCIQIDEPELMHEIQLSKVEIGHSMIAGLENQTKTLHTIACNDNALESTASFN